jgi:hypothetical protein
MQEEAFDKRLLGKHAFVTKTTELACTNVVPNYDYDTKIYL